MKLIVRKPGVGYLDSWLWLPKTRASEAHVSSTLSYMGRDNQLLKAWEEEPDHFRVPRNYFKPETLRKLPYPVYDTRPKGHPRVNLVSSVVLDAREPSKDYQRRGCKALLNTYDGILCLRCGAGKTLTALHSAAQLHVPILVTVTDYGLSEQWAEEVCNSFGIEESRVGYIGGGKFDWQKEVVIAQVATLSRRASDYALPPEMTSHFGVVICDEAHVMGAPYFSKAIPPFSCRRWGLSATPQREDEFDSLLNYIMGDVVYTYLEPDLKPSFVFRQLPTSLNRMDPVIRRESHDKRNNFHYGKTYGYLARTNKDNRTAHILKDLASALAAGRTVLVLTHSKEMTEILGKAVPRAGVVNGDVSGQDRKQRIRECNPLVSIMNLGKQALNKPSLDTLFIVEPFSKAGILQQTMGRILRSFSGKANPMVVVYEDPSIPEMAALTKKMKRLLNKWPNEKGGKIPFTVKKL